MQAADSGCAWVNWRRLQEGEWNNFSRVCGQEHVALFQGKHLGCICILFNITPLPCLRAYEHGAAVGSPACHIRHALLCSGCATPAFTLTYEMPETETKDRPCAQALLQLCRNIARLCDCCGMAGRLKDCREGRVRCRGMHSRSHITFWACGKASTNSANIRQARVCSSQRML